MHKVFEFDNLSHLRRDPDTPHTSPYTNYSVDALRPACIFGFLFNIRIWYPVRRCPASDSSILD